MDPLDAAVRIMRETGGKASVVSFNISEPDLENFMKQPWTVTSSDGGPGHPREYATFQTKYAVYVKQKQVIDTAFLQKDCGVTPPEEPPTTPTPEPECVGYDSNGDGVISQDECVPTTTAETGLGDNLDNRAAVGAGNALMLIGATMLFGAFLMRPRRR